jgi:hypothetical protein
VSGREEADPQRRERGSSLRLEVTAQKLKLKLGRKLERKLGLLELGERNEEESEEESRGRMKREGRLAPRRRWWWWW